MTRQKSGPGAPKGHRLTKIDCEVLRQVARLGFQSYPELRAGPLKSFCREHSWSAMKKLVLNGHLGESLGDNGELRGWHLTRSEQRLVEANNQGKEWAPTCRAPSFRTSYRHELILREVRLIIESSRAVQSWIPEHQLRRDLMRKSFSRRQSNPSEKIAALPDALFQLRSGGRGSVAALEVELTQKSRKRLFQKFEAHILNAEFQYVFYAVDGEGLLKTLWNVYREVREKSTRIKLSKRQNGMFFVTLDVLRKMKLDAKWTGVSDSFSFNDLAA